MNQGIDDPVSLLAALDRGESLPAHWYTDPNITAREIEQIFRKSWHYIGPAKELTQIGDYITGYVGEVPVVVIRNEEGLDAFVNVCRHRRHEVMKGRGNARIMQCGYHAWAYDLGGCLKRAPRSGAEPNFRLEDYPLLPIRVDTLGPFVFANINRSALPVASYFGDVLKVIAECGINLDTLELYSREEWTSDANWKSMLENYLECYHCPVAHPGFSAAIDVVPENYHLTAHGWFLSQVGPVRQSALEGKTAVKIYDARGELKQAQYHVLWPNFTININPGFANLSLDVWIPDGPNHTKGFSEQYFGPGVSEKFAEELIEFNKQVGIEDDDLTNSVQHGLLGGIPDRGRFLTNSEHLVVQFQKLVVKTLTKGAAVSMRAVETAAPATRTISVNSAESLAPEAERNASFQLEVAKVEDECDVIRSFYLRRADGSSLAPWQPGQFLPIQVKVDGHPEPLLRTYTLSTGPNPDFYRLSIRRMDPGLVSRFLHDNAKPGFRIQAIAPRGKFILDELSSRPVVLLSGGVGLTPMIAICEHIVAEGRRTGIYRPIYFLHSAQNSGAHAFARHIKDLAAAHPAMVVRTWYSRPGTSDELGATHDAEGKITIDAVQRVLPFGDYDFYLCGPSSFMSSLYSGLIAEGVPSGQIHYESFGPSTVLKPEVPHKAQLDAANSGREAHVRFARAGIDATWSRGQGTLLELAEEAGLAPAFGCRSGICGTCTTKILSGTVDYLEEPLAPRGLDDVLLCCSTPRRTSNRNGESHEPDVVLDL